MTQWYYTVQGFQQGPVSEDQLKALAADGTLRPEEFVWAEGMDNWASASTFPGLFTGRGAAVGVDPHRGGMILALGILGLVVCVICGIFAWVMANNDLRRMAAGQMDPSGEPLTQAGKIIAIVAVVMKLAGFALALVFFSLRMLPAFVF